MSPGAKVNGCAPVAGLALVPGNISRIFVAIANRSVAALRDGIRFASIASIADNRLRSDDVLPGMTRSRCS